MRPLLIALLLAAGSGTTFAQSDYTFEMRLIPDGAAGAPVIPNSGPAYPINNPSNVFVSRVSFWLQARVAQTVNQNWGVVRATSPAGGTSASYISIADPTGTTSISRGLAGHGGVNGTLARYGRTVNYFNGGASTGETGNSGTSVPFPGTTGNQNGGLDSDGSGPLTTRVYAFDSYVGSTRAGDGSPEFNPWNINGAAGSGPAFPSDGTFSPWATLYRVYVDINDLTTARVITINASAALRGAVRVVPTDDTYGSWAMQQGPEQVLTASYTILIPAPSAGGVLLAGLALATRRRRA